MLAMVTKPIRHRGQSAIAEQRRLNLLWPSAEEWLPASAMPTIAEGGNTNIGFGTAFGLTAAYAVGAYLLAAATCARRDITA